MHDNNKPTPPAWAAVAEHRTAELGLDRKSIAAAIGVGVSAYGHYLRGGRAIPTDRAIKLAEVLQMSMDDLFSDRDEILDSGGTISSAAIDAPIVGKIIVSSIGVGKIIPSNLGVRRVYSRDPGVVCYQDDSGHYEPRIRLGNIIAVEPGTPVRPEDDVLIILTNGDVMIWQYLADVGAHYRVNDVNDPSKRRRIPKSDVLSIYPICGIFRAP